MVLDLTMKKIEELVGEGEETSRDGDREALPGSILQKVQENSWAFFSWPEKLIGELMSDDFVGEGALTMTFWWDNYKQA